MWLLIKSIHIIMSDGKSYTKNKFELDIYLLDEVYAIPIKCKTINKIQI